ncbi:hypothetical protein AAWM_05678 [Aspergillus awamori]|uniref:Contig An08c0140, genomic contig n=7 Tax=Aspergillus TaxID=5052 RepID=A2QRN1_ASPNC|nr:uncharacterized protein An08g06620 [Aspergillus niger]XP_025456819.1 uncharacterized protein BO96DRAFT_454785 [Aspergillus niger CBS 101883]XP_026631556.1 hypothetical protein BDQ94DRAFT_165666 [Aspergillus welwitschiae]EHA18212.1 hypothetical protein ASPNIDRAFT_207948 [Aspergillus niger ATCC 1015]RDH17301.1 hypothetical protein M747DRAFT_333717 [Aspergillus niger ATCC 13496]RDK47790.1 hypothetical protein M752DRAFT_272031 [Aspergillus phoenicis ATCC 13157]GCB22793.1 hypothetical protein A|eukprot:XP_001392777.1 hypothetical protein ANI_1_936074 [Aspergillus niger CBS 513.88]
MSEQTFHTTTQDIRKPESHVSQAHDGKTPKNSNVSAMKSIIDQNTDKQAQIDKAQSNLPLPEDPPRASDWNSMDQRTVNVGSGGREGPVSGENNSALREPATASSSVRVSGEEYHTNTQPMSGVGRQGKDNLEGLPRDALYR